jgi:hypothetical protein
MKFHLLIDFDFDLGIKFFVPGMKKQSAPALVGSRPLRVEDFPANKLAVDCVKCHRRVKKNSGYKNFYGAGFYCEYCQMDADFPVRVLVLEQAGGAGESVSPGS